MGKKAEVVEAEVVNEHQSRFDMVETEEQLPAAKQQFTPMDMIMKAMESDADVDRLEKLWALQVKFEEREAEKAFNRAFAAFKAEAISIINDKHVDYTGQGGRVQYDHSSIGNVIQTITPPLSKHGLALSWDTVQNGQITTTCTLTHELGFSRSTSLSAGKDTSGKKNDIQQVASAQTYLQRYTALSITGLATQDQKDDDGIGSQPVEYVTEEQWRELDTLLTQIKSKSTEDICKAYRIEGLDLLPAKSFDNVKERLNAIIEEEKAL